MADSEREERPWESAEGGAAEHENWREYVELQVTVCSGLDLVFVDLGFVPQLCLYTRTQRSFPPYCVALSLYAHVRSFLPYGVYCCEDSGGLELDLYLRVRSARVEYWVLNLCREAKSRIRNADGITTNTNTVKTGKKQCRLQSTPHPVNSIADL